MSERSFKDIAQDLGTCALSWEPGVRVLGDVTAKELNWFVRYAVGNMPTTEVICPHCDGEIDELIERMNKDVLREGDVQEITCPYCDMPVELGLTGVSFQFDIEKIEPTKEGV